ncbi:low molecular weight protein arginine phosphatase [Clostridium bovifaecis]|uniref:Low molecular weight protein arginine phosphatase n=1 Tax=Clostridium bovifaecis TaxID=2184719 RepID=A0A6I6EPX2_9CLOT|nr:low molecular weight protein arginine phosphatase [Clostridium bovifaecis]
MKILFVCTGNTCRSCMAEAIFNKLSDIEGVEAYSAGISIMPRSKTSKNAAILIKENFNLDISEREAVQLTEEDLRKSDLILTMTTYMKELICEAFPQYQNKIYTLNGYVDLENDVMDPYGGDMKTYKTTFDMLNKGVELLLHKLKGR